MSKVRYAETTVIDRRTGKPRKVRVPVPMAEDHRDAKQMAELATPATPAPHSGRHAHRAERAKAATVERESRQADAAKHPHKGWTATGQKIARQGSAEKLYTLTKIAPAERPESSPMRYARKRKGVGGTITGGVTAGSNLPGAKAEDAHSTEVHSLQRESGSLIAKVEAKLGTGSREGIGELRLECREMALRVRVSNPAASAKLFKLHEELKLQQYETARYV